MADAACLPLRASVFLQKIGVCICAGIRFCMLFISQLVCAVLLGAFVTIALNLLADVLYSAVDPRIRLDGVRR